MATMEDNTPKFEGKQKLLWNFSVRYVHLLREIFTSGEVAKMGAPAFTLWCCLKVHSNFNDGFGYPRAETLADILQQSLSSTNKQLKKLEDMGYVEKKKNGRKVLWRCTEKFSVTEETTQTENPVDMPYIPKEFEDKLKALKLFRSGEITAEVLKDKGVTIHYSPQVQYIIQNGNNNNVYQTGANTEFHAEPSMAELLENVANMKKQIAEPSTPSNQRKQLATWIPALEKQIEEQRSKE